jgi:DNA-binding SARP family transcriptional activator
VEFRILGPLEVSHEGRPVAIPGARQRELLAILLLHAGEVVSTDRLMDALWGEGRPAAGTTALRVRVSQLRKALGPGGRTLVTRPPGYALLVERDGLDLRRFERELDEAHRSLAAGDAAGALRHAHSALSLWRGPPLADFAYASFAQAAIARLEELQVAALELRIDAELALGRHGIVVGELQALVEAHPLRERLWRQLMLALYRDGRQADALAAYRSARTRLVEEIGIEPGRELQALEARMLAQDPALVVDVPDEAPAHARRSVLALPGPEALDGGVPVVAERLAARAAHELLIVALLGDPHQVGDASARLAAVRERARARGVDARVAAFATADRGADGVRLAAQQDAAVLVLAAPAGALRAGAIEGDVQRVLADAVCDVVVLAGPPYDAAPAAGPVLVPFAGHDHDWAAVEVGAWLAGDAPLRLLGLRAASRLLASASLALQRGTGTAAEPVLVDAGADAVVAVAAGASAIVIGLSERWRRDGIGKARLAIAERAPCPVLFVRGGLRPGGLAPPHALTRFTWSGASQRTHN